jgi:hypothetical protein
MSHTSSVRRAACITGATGLIALSMGGPASARPDPGTGGFHEHDCTVTCYQGPESGTSIPTPPVDGNGIEVLQLGAGLLAGIALAGAGMSVATRRSHGHVVHPA